MMMTFRKSYNINENPILLLDVNLIFRYFVHITEIWQNIVCLEINVKKTKNTSVYQKWNFCKILKILIFEKKFEIFPKISFFFKIFEKSKFSNSIIIVNFWKILSIQVVETLFNIRRIHWQQKNCDCAHVRALLILENGKKCKNHVFLPIFD